MKFDRRLGLALVVFLVAFVGSTTAALVRLQRVPVAPPPGPGLKAATADLHTLVSGSLLLAGLYPEDVLAEHVVERREEETTWNEYEREILAGHGFSLREWLDSLGPALQRSGARFSSAGEGENGLVVRVTCPLPGKNREILVETLRVKLRPSPDQLARHDEGERHRAALVIDDLGQNPAHLRRLAALGLPLTVSVLPQLPLSEATALTAADHGMEVLLHLPMEPLDFPEKHPGPGALLSNMTEDQIRRQVKAALASVPRAAGVNNHMGSRLTADSPSMEALMGALRSEGLFFFDSRTSPRSLGFETAYRFGLPTAQRDIFIDAHDDKDFIRSQVRSLLDLALHEGAAIGIGHPYDNTLEVLEEMREELLGSGIEWVPLSGLLIRPRGLEARHWER